MIDFKDKLIENDDWEWEDNISSGDGEEKKFQWYSARTFITNEEKLIETLWERIRQHNLSEEVQEILTIKEHLIVEDEELTPDSPELPKREFLTSKSKVWVQLKNGNFKKIRLTVRKPFKCFIFFKMSGEYEVFSKINSWMLGLRFLGFPKPNVISEAEIEGMKKLVSPNIPNLLDYVVEKGYQIIKGSVSKYVNTQAFESFVDSELDSEVDDSGLLESPEAFFRTKTESREFIESSSKSDSERKEISLKKLKINDFVYLVEMGAKGVVREIDLGNELITIHINLFGRNQTIKCTPQQLREF